MRSLSPGHKIREARRRGLGRNGCLHSFNFKCDEEEKREGRKMEPKAIRLAGLQFF